VKAISFPEIQDFDIQSFQKPAAYIGAAGFEDRALAVLDKAKQRKNTFEYVIGVEYEPFDPRNRKEEFQKLASKAVSNESNIKWVTYNREKPGEFGGALTHILQICSQVAHIYLDISAMSKFLSLILLQALRDIDASLTITYVEPEVYHPNKKEFREKIEEAKRTRKVPEFLTSGVYEVITTSALSSVSMQSYSTALVAFPTFNHKLLSALQSEVTPQDLIILEGEPLRDSNKWRRSAVKQLNELFYSSARKTEVVSTFYYKETVEQLEALYKEYQFTHEFIIAPANSKLQTVGVFFFKQMHPEVQIVYPTPKSFLLEQYTEGIMQVHQIPFSNFRQFIGNLDGHRYLTLAELRENLSLLKVTKGQNGFYSKDDAK